MSDNLRYLHKWLNEEQDAPIDRVALAEALAEIDHYRSVMEMAAEALEIAVGYARECEPDAPFHTGEDALKALRECLKEG